MQITRKSPLTGISNTQELDITQDQLDELNSRSPGRRSVQDIFPDLNASQREFLITGYTQEDWDEIFGDSEE